MSAWVVAKRNGLRLMLRVQDIGMVAEDHDPSQTKVYVTTGTPQWCWVDGSFDEVQDMLKATLESES